ncbi:gp80 [Alphaproteobacteria phage PhiJL001]|uniref:Gp80 n=1 Tax=Alphaproteobacteria phage PhiJL001 TaxID=2681607 RepID=Q5DN25_9CAUD|nr:gp80 [Alphaproteobacteria phage PhiJL001]AAT69478.1 gp80 [Alphaproteobacteria phage PhiJL001]
MALKLTNALSGYDLAEYVNLDCGAFDLKIQQAAIHNEKFRAAIAKKALIAKKKSLIPDQGSMTGSFEQDVELFIDNVILGWGTRPLIDDDGEPVAFNRENLVEIFTGSREGRILFGKIQSAAVDDTVFAIKEEDLGN